MSIKEIQNKVNRITDILRRDDGINGAMGYTEQISWVLFLKFFNDYEENKYDTAELNGEKYDFIISPQFRWSQWACPKNDDGTPKKKVDTGKDLNDFVNDHLFPYLKDFSKSGINHPKSPKYKIGAIFEYLDNKIASGHTLREVLDIVDTLDFQSQEELHELSVVYEGLLQGMGSDGGNSGEFYTPRAIIKSIVEVIEPRVGQSIYDGAIGSAGFLVDAFEFLMQSEKRESYNTTQLKTIQEDTFFGFEKTSLGYVMGMMNMILHGIESPNVYKQNTLTQNIRDIQEKERHDIILANPPFGGKEKSQIQQNFPVQSNATELLFLQHFMKMLKLNGKAAIVVPEGVLFQTNAAFAKVKEDLLHHFNLHTILSLPSGVFLPYSGVKTNVIFFERKGATSDIWYYEVEPPYKLTKNKPLSDEHMADFVRLYKNPKNRNKGKQDWTVHVNEIKEFDLSAKNPSKEISIEYKSPKDLLDVIKEDDALIENLTKKLRKSVLDRELNRTISLKEDKLENLITEMVSGFACNKSNEKPNGFVHLRTHNIDFTGKLNFDLLIKIDNRKVDLKKSKLKSGDILFNNTNSKELVGKTALIDQDYDYGFSNHLTRIRVDKNKINAEYLVNYLMNLHQQGYFLRICKKWIGQAGVNSSMLKETIIKYPIDPKDQEIINEKVRTVNDGSNMLIKEIEVKINNLKSLKASLLDSAFKGEL
ncbi:N-6 DNA methylase [Roseivirga echinicomitans]|uniref:N-6 DNA methylase n=1 Tax=Roseivirga echinicomitans TaxID=296218 RepID=UPI0009FD1234|nr:N-6 DNA methylase [Roseivirga echinicomitans]